MTPNKLQPPALRHAVNTLIGLALWALILAAIGHMLGW